MESSIKIYSFLILLIPVSLISGPLISDGIIVIVCFFFICEFFFLKKHENLFYSNFFKIFLIIFFLLILSSILSSNPIYSLKTSLPYFRYAVFTLALIYLIKNNNKFFNNLYYVLLFCLLFLNLDAIFQFFNGINIIGQSHPNPDRITSFFGNEIKLGSYISRLLPLHAFLYFYTYQNQKFSGNSLFYINLILSGFAVVLSGERFALITFSIFVFTFILIDKKNIIKNLSLFFILFLLISSLLNFSDYHKNRFVTKPLEDIKKMLNFDIKKTIIINDKYTDLYTVSFKMFEKNVFFGIGPKNFRHECKKYQKEYKKGCSTHPHHALIQILTETGIINFVIFFVFFLVNLKDYLKNLLKNNNTENQILIFINLHFIISLNPLLPSGNFFNNWISIIYFFPLALYLLFRNNTIYKI